MKERGSNFLSPQHNRHHIDAYHFYPHVSDDFGPELLAPLPVILPNLLARALMNH